MSIDLNGKKMGPVKHPERPAAQIPVHKCGSPGMADIMRRPHFSNET